MKTQHTPTPWWINQTNGSEKEICSGPSSLDAESQSKIVTVALAHGPSGEWGKVGAEHRANAALIVKAVNAHEELLAAAKYFRSLVDADLLDALERNGNLHSQAIAKAEEK